MDAADEEKRTVKKPLSLNERTDLILQSMSRSRPAKPQPPPQAEEGEVRKVRIEGRRRLCKIKSRSPSPPPPLPANGNAFNLFCLDSPEKNDEGNKGEEQIRDILTDLTSKLECLSMEKPKRSLVVENESDGDGNEFGSANSTLSLGHSSRIDKGKVVEEWEDREDKEECVLVGSEGEEELGLRDRGDIVVHLSDDDDDDDDDVEVLGDMEEIEENEKDREDIVMDGKCGSKLVRYVLPAKIAAILFPHQREGLSWLWSLHCGCTGGILGDDMGLGKTMQISSYLAGLFHSGLIKRALIVAPKTLLSHWIKELTVVGLSKKIKDYYGTSMKLRNYELDLVLEVGGVLLTTYDIVRINFKSLRGDFFSHRERFEDEIVWDYVILDEGHIIKNPSTQRSKSLMEIPSSHRIIISGTPIQNNLKELWALFYFCCPQVLGDKQEFKEKFEYKILRGNEKESSDRDKYIGSTVAKGLRERIKPYFLRRLKSDVFNESDTTKSQKLSAKNELVVWIRLSHLQRKLYEAFLNSELVSSSVTGSPLAAITILKKICDHPLLLTKRAAEEVMDGMESLLNKDDIGMVEDMTTNLLNMTLSGESQQLDYTVSSKLCFLMTLLNNLLSDGHTILIFSQTRKMMNFIQEAIESKGYTYLRIDGTTKISERERIINDFQAGAAPIFLLTSRVGGLGLTLTRADRVIVADPAWNPSMDNQSVDRAYRIGQEKDVLVYRLMTCGTVEEKIYKMQVFKGGLFKIATEQKDQTRYFSKKDLQDMFRLPTQGFDISLTQQQMLEEHDHQKQMDDTLVKHISFLEKQGIAGVSHHSMLFSKTADVPLVPIDDNNDKLSPRRNIIVSKGSSSSYVEEHHPNGSEYALNPKSEKHQFKLNSTQSEPKGLQQEIEESIKRRLQMLANKDLISRLPDKGGKIRSHIAQLQLQLGEMKSSSSTKEAEADVIAVDNLSDVFQNGFKIM